jgi:hypothetical protein
VWQLLRNENTYFYICGDVCMANDVFATLIEIAKREGNLSDADAQAFFRDMKVRPDALTHTHTHTHTQHSIWRCADCCVCAQTCRRRVGT